MLSLRFAFAKIEKHFCCHSLVSALFCGLGLAARVGAEMEGTKPSSHLLGHLCVLLRSPVPGLMKCTCDQEGQTFETGVRLFWARDPLPSEIREAVPLSL